MACIVFLQGVEGFGFRGVRVKGSGLWLPGTVLWLCSLQNLCCRNLKGWN